MLPTLFPYGTDCGKAKAILIENQLNLPFLFKIRLVSILLVDFSIKTLPLF